MAKIGTTDEPAGQGHNSGNEPLNQTAQGQLKSIVERIERLIDERGEINEQIKEVKAEAKGNGFDTTAIMATIKLRAQDRAKLAEKRAILELYVSAIDPALLDLV